MERLGMGRGAFAAVGAAVLLAACAGMSRELRDPDAPDPPSPARWSARFETTVGIFAIDVHREWAPRGADRFYRLVRGRYYDGSKIFRVIPGYIAQFGIAADPRVAQAWRYAYLSDEPSREKCRRGVVAFADKGAGTSTRATQIFVNLADNPQLDTSEFAPFGRVVSGMDVLDRLHGYGREGPQGERTDQSAIFERGNAYLDEKYPALDTIRRATAETERP